MKSNYSIGLVFRFVASGISSLKKLVDIKFLSNPDEQNESSQWIFNSYGAQLISVALTMGSSDEGDIGWWSRKVVWILWSLAMACPLCVIDAFCSPGLRGTPRCGWSTKHCRKCSFVWVEHSNKEFEFCSIGICFLDVNAGRCIYWDSFTCCLFQNVTCVNLIEEQGPSVGTGRKPSEPRQRTQTLSREKERRGSCWYGSTLVVACRFSIFK